MEIIGYKAFKNGYVCWDGKKERMFSKKNKYNGEVSPINGISFYGTIRGLFSSDEMLDEKNIIVAKVKAAGNVVEQPLQYWGMQYPSRTDNLEIIGEIPSELLLKEWGDWVFFNRENHNSDHLINFLFEHRTITEEMLEKIIIYGDYLKSLERIIKFEFLPENSFKLVLDRKKNFQYEDSVKESELLKTILKSKMLTKNALELILEKIDNEDVLIEAVDSKFMTEEMLEKLAKKRTNINVRTKIMKSSLITKNIFDIIVGKLDYEYSNELLEAIGSKFMTAKELETIINRSWNPKVLLKMTKSNVLTEDLSLLLAKKIVENVSEEYIKSYIINNIESLSTNLINHIFYELCNQFYKDKDDFDTFKTVLEFERLIYNKQISNCNKAEDKKEYQRAHYERLKPFLSNERFNVRLSAAKQMFNDGLISIEELEAANDSVGKLLQK